MIKNICKNCGKEYEYEPKRGTYKFQYCSQDCKHEYAQKDALPQYRICECCGKEYWWDATLKNYEGNFFVDTKRFCSFECGKTYKYNKIKESTLTNQGAIGWASEKIREKCKQTKLEHYGNENYNNREQCKQTCLNKYGVEYVSKVEEFKQKMNNTWKEKSKDELNDIYARRRHTTMERYGVEYPSQNEMIKNKVKETNLERYGVESYTQTEEYKQRTKQTCLDKYGVEHPAQNEVIKNKMKDQMSKRTEDDWNKTLEKRKQTCLNKYNVEFPQSLDAVKQKTRETNLKKYGNETAIQSDELQAKVKAHNLEKFGTEYSIGSAEIQEKIRKTNLEKYGYEYPFQSEELRKIMEDNRKETLKKKYGIEHLMQLPEFKEKAKETCTEKYGVPYNCLSKNCLNASYNTISKINLKFKKELDDNHINNELEYHIGIYGYDLKCDNILIELNPTFTHNSTKTLKEFIKPKDKYYHINKTKEAIKNGFRCIHIWDWDNQNKIVQSLKNKEKLYARKLYVGKVAEDKCNEFLNTYHFQNSCRGQEIRLGLYYKDKLIQIMTFGKSRYNNHYQYELLRLCTNSNFIVIGGAEKLFKYFINSYHPNSIISYCDNSKFTGEVYTKIGMTLDDYGSPRRHWYNIDTKKHITEALLLKRGYSQLHNDTEHHKGESNEELMLKAGYLEVYDCGQSTYVWHKK